MNLLLPPLPPVSFEQTKLFPAKPRPESHQAILEALSVRDTMTTVQLAEITGTSWAHTATTLQRMAGFYLVRQIRPGKRGGRGELRPAIWSLRCYRQ